MSVESTAVAVTSVAATFLTSATAQASVQNPVRLTMRASVQCHVGADAATSAHYRVTTAFPFDLTVTRPVTLSAFSSQATTATLWVIAAR